ncbi:MAG TPA: hypothetical protein VKW78_13970 [Terriglobales bacterium]|nr:hypothetical protein [Terriglobales bacterium]
MAIPVNLFLNQEKSECTSTTTDFPDLVRSEAELASMYASPAQASIRKVTSFLTPAYREMIEASRFLVISTIGPNGIDTSPRGDSPGFVRVKDKGRCCCRSGEATTESIR